MLYTREQLIARIQADKEFFSAQSDAVKQAWSAQLSYFYQQVDTSDDGDAERSHCAPDGPEVLQC